MRRSEINKTIDSALEFFQKINFPLPPFAHWTLKTWRTKGNKFQEIYKARLGWDVTDFGSGRFLKLGRTIFTLRNGLKGDFTFTKPYSQKIMYLYENQKPPIHYHQSKTEDIINQGGGNILIKLWLSTKKGKRTKKDLKISIDGKEKTVKAGKIVRLKPGESIWVKPFTYHQFYAEKGSGNVLSMEISSINDDLNDNFWLKEMVRFPKITEDTPIKYLLCHEYGKFIKVPL